jgi:hypothetical protein
MIHIEVTAGEKVLKYFIFSVSIILLLSCTPPEKSLRERYVQDNPEIKMEIEKAILKGDIIVGMTKEHVYASRATPIFKGEKQEEGKTYEYWTFPNMKDSPFVNVYFEDNIVVIIEKTDKEPAIK